MTNPDIRTKLIEFIAQKNLPLDLQVEILDHISEQIIYKMEVESKDFPVAFAEIKEAWKEDLTMKKTFFARESRTKIHRDTHRKADIEILKKSGFYYMLYFLVTVFLIFYSKILASQIIYGIFSAMTLIFFLLLLFNYKILNFSSRNNKQKISYLQQGAGVFIMAGIFIPFQLLLDFTNKFDKYYLSIFNLVNHGQITIISVATFFIFNMYAFGWIYGFLYFLEYKKSLKMLEQKINFKL